MNERMQRYIEQEQRRMGLPVTGGSGLSLVERESLRRLGKDPDVFARTRGTKTFTEWQLAKYGRIPAPSRGPVAPDHGGGEAA